MTAPLVYPPTPSWAHERLVWWAALVRTWGYTQPLPAWTRRPCVAAWPDTHCPCGMYRVSWDDVAGIGKETQDHASKE